MYTVLFFIIVIFAMGYYFINVNDKNNNKDDKKSNSNSEVEKINDVNNIKLYVTDFKYDEKINGYIYEEMPLTDGQITNLKKEVSEIDLSVSNDKTIYGKYKIVIDNKTIFFDSDDGYALYKNKNYTISFPKKLSGKLIIKNQKLCSCCATINCNINLCSCNN